MEEESFTLEESRGGVSFGMSGEERKESVGKWLLPVIGALVCLGLGSASGLVSNGGGSAWYQNLVKPPGTPPPWVFGPVWSLLYLMMGVAAGMLIHRRAWRVLAVFGVQLMLNLAWTPLFFGMKEITWALMVIILLWITLAVTLGMASRRYRTAAWLLVPYGAWVAYATYLNAGIWWLNR